MPNLEEANKFQLLRCRDARGNDVWTSYCEQEPQGLPRFMFSTKQIGNTLQQIHLGLIEDHYAAQNQLDDDGKDGEWHLVIH